MKQVCVYCKQEYESPSMDRLHGQSYQQEQPAVMPDCMAFPCTCEPHQGPYHAKSCPRSKYWDRELNRSLGFPNDTGVEQKRGS